VSNTNEDMSSDALAIMQDVGADLKKLKSELQTSDAGSEDWKVRLLKIASTITAEISPDNEPPTDDGDPEEKPEPKKPAPKKPEPKEKPAPKKKEPMKESFSKGDKVIIKNAKSYDVFRKATETGTVVGNVNGKVNVKVGTGSMTVDSKDLVKESLDEGSKDWDSRFQKNSRSKERNAGEDSPKEKPRINNAIYSLYVDGKPLKLGGKEVTGKVETLKKTAATLMKKPFNKDKKFTLEKIKD